jgi:hypothetical protein
MQRREIFDNVDKQPHANVHNSINETFDLQP